MVRTLRRALFRGLVRLFGGPHPPPPPNWDSGPQRVLFMRYDRVGDMITSLGVIRTIARAHPTLRVDILASPANAEVARREPAVEEVVVLEPRRPARALATIRDLRKRRYDAVVDMFVFDRRVPAKRIILMLAIGARYRVGIGGRGYDFAYSLKARKLPDHLHHIDYVATLAEPFGVTYDDVDGRPRLMLTDAERDRAEAVWRESGDGMRVLINVSARGESARRWPDDRFAAVAAHLRAHHSSSAVLVIGLPDDQRSVARIAEAAGGHWHIPASLFDAFALVGAADLMLTPNTGLVHVASAFGTPSVVLHRQCDQEWQPYRVPARNLFAGEFVDEISLDRVLAALDELIAETAGMRGG